MHRIDEHKTGPQNKVSWVSLGWVWTTAGWRSHLHCLPKSK